MVENGSTRDGSPSLNEDGSTQTTVFKISQPSVSRFITLLGPMFDCMILFLSAGTPFWYYCLVHPKVPSDEMELGSIDSTRTADNINPWLEQYWRKRIQRLSDIWKAHRVIVGAILPPTFTLISVSALPKCSWAYIFGALCLLYSSITFVVCIIHGIYFSNIDDFNLRGSSRIVSDSGFFNKDTLRFYVSLSLPTVWFTGFLGSFALAILMIMVGERDSRYKMGPSTSSMACEGDHLKFLQAVVPFMLVIAIISLVRMKSALRYFFFSQEDAR